MIEFKNVNKAYDTKGGKNIILDNVSFKFPKSQNIGVKYFVKADILGH